MPGAVRFGHAQRAGRPVGQHPMRARPTPERLPLRCEPITGESLNGFVHRLAERNGAKPRALLSFMGRRPFPVRLGYGTVLADLAALSGREPEELQAMAGTISPLRAGHDASFNARVFLGQVVSGLQVRSWRRAVCPACLAEERHHRASWELVFVQACAVHRCGLVTACPSCSVPLDWNTSELAKCSCGRALDALPSEMWHELRLTATDYVTARLRGTAPPIEPACLQDVPLLHAVEMLRFFGALAGGLDPWAVRYNERDPWLGDHLTGGLHLLLMGPEQVIEASSNLLAAFETRPTLARDLEVWCRWIEGFGNAETKLVLDVVRATVGIAERLS